MKLHALAAVLAAAGIVSAAYAQTPGNTQVGGATAQSPAQDMEHVLVVMPLHKTSVETAFPVTSLYGDALSREAASTLGNTLANLPGIHNASFGPGVGQPVIRGLGGPRVMTLQNGTRSADVSGLSGDHTVAVEPLLADSIEVMRGPASLLFGGGAIGGVVNVVDGRIPTQIREDTEVAMALRYSGADRGRSAVFRLDSGLNALQFHFDALARDADNLGVPQGSGSEAGDELENTHARATSATMGMSYHFKQGFWGLAVNRQESQYGLPGGSHAHGHDEDHADHDEDLADEDPLDEAQADEEVFIRLDMQQTRYDAALHLHDVIPGIETLRGFLSVTEYEHLELEGIEIGTVYSSDTTEGRLELLHDTFAGWHGVLGGQFSTTTFSAVGEESFVPKTDITRRGLFLLEDWHSGDWQVEAGLRMDRDTLSPYESVFSNRDFTSLSASLGLIYELTPQWHISTSLSRAERAPAVEELYANGANSDVNSWVVHAATQAIELGDASLDTELALNLDVGLTLHHDEHTFRVSLYRNDFDRFINLANTGTDVGGIPVRIYEQQGAKFVGGEIEGDWLLGSFAGGEVSLTTDADWVRGRLDRGGDIPRLPPLTLRLGLQWQGERAFYYGRVSHATEQDRPGDNETSTASWLRWDFGADWQFDTRIGLLTLRAALHNMSDETVRLSTSWLRDEAPEPGRSLDIGFQLAF